MVAISMSISAGLAILFGIAILIWPKLLRIVLGLWLIIYGILQFVSF